MCDQPCSCAATDLLKGSITGSGPCDCTCLMYKVWLPPSVFVQGRQIAGGFLNTGRTAAVVLCRAFLILSSCLIMSSLLSDRADAILILVVKTPNHIKCKEKAASPHLRAYPLITHTSWTRINRRTPPHWMTSVQTRKVLSVGYS